MGVRQLLVGNLGQVRIAKAAGFAVRGDFGLNIYNSRSMQYLRGQGVDSQLLSFELTLPQIRDVSKAVPAEVHSLIKRPPSSESICDGRKFSVTDVPTTALSYA